MYSRIICNTFCFFSILGDNDQCDDEIVEGKDKCTEGNEDSLHSVPDALETGSVCDDAKSNDAKSEDADAEAITAEANEAESNDAEANEAEANDSEADIGTVSSCPTWLDVHSVCSHFPLILCCNYRKLNLRRKIGGKIVCLLPSFRIPTQVMKKNEWKIEKRQPMRKKIQGRFHVVPYFMIMLIFLIYNHGKN